MYENENFDNFYEAINNLMNSKLVFASSYISELLHTIADNDAIYNLIARCMINFDFIEQWQISVSSGRLVLPEENLKKIAFIFCMLNNIDDKNLDLNKILDRYYSYKVDMHPFEIFKRQVIEVFGNLIFDELNITIQNEENPIIQTSISGSENFVDTKQMEFEQDDESEIQDNDETENEIPHEVDSVVEEDTEETTEDPADLEEMLELVMELKNQIRKMKKLKGTKISKVDLIALVSTLEFAIKTDASEYFYGLVLSIKYLVMPMKNLKFLAEKIEMISNKIIRS